MDLPIVCRLTEDKLLNVRGTILNPLRCLTTGVESIATGYAYSFPATSEMLHEITRLVDLERQCCQFLTFNIIVAPKALILREITGPTEARSVIANYFGDDNSHGDTIGS